MESILVRRERERGKEGKKGKEEIEENKEVFIGNILVVLCIQSGESLRISKKKGIQLVKFHH